MAGTERIVCIFCGGRAIIKKQNNLKVISCPQFNHINCKEMNLTDHLYKKEEKHDWSIDSKEQGHVFI